MDSSPSRNVQQLPSSSMESRPETSRKPSLLPAFEPLSSSPGFPRPQSSKRKFGEASPTLPKQSLKYYPTPVPTSSTGILTSSSPRHVRPSMTRNISTLSERAPLQSVPSVDIPANGEIVRMGRSSNSSDFQLSSNRLISRVHVHAAYYAPNAYNPNGVVMIECMGWNGAKVHCRGAVYELGKGETYESNNPDDEIMLDVQDTRVMIVWPNVASRTKAMWDSDDDDATPTHRTTQDHFASSPPVIPRSPVSQSPIRQPDFGPSLLAQSPAPVQIFEDESDGENIPPPRAESPAAAAETFIRPASSPAAADENANAGSTKSVRSSFGDDFSDGDEENDPVVHSFGPFGANLLPRMESFSTATPLQPVSARGRRPQSMSSPQSQESVRPEHIQFKESPIKNHVINQLAFSRIHSVPLSTIHGNLPSELKACIAKPKDDNDDDPEDRSRRGSPTPVPELSRQELKKLMDAIPCVGEIPRSGKDAAGQPLENEFYYVPEMDTDHARRDTVSSGMRGHGIRNVRKQHKQYYWKKPRV